VIGVVLNFLYATTPTELSKRGVLLDTGRGATTKTGRAIARHARSNEASKKRVGKAAHAA
jgi:hypothetical protein